MRLSVPLYSPVQALNFAKGRKAECTGNILTEYSPKRNLIALEILNEEMSPLLKQHDIVIVELGVNPEPKDIVLAKVPGLEKALLREYVILRFDAMGKEGRCGQKVGPRIIDSRFKICTHKKRLTRR